MTCSIFSFYNLSGFLSAALHSGFRFIQDKQSLYENENNSFNILIQHVQRIISDRFLRGLSFSAYMDTYNIPWSNFKPIHDFIKQIVSEIFKCKIKDTGSPWPAVEVFQQNWHPTFFTWRRRKIYAPKYSNFVLVLRFLRLKKNRKWTESKAKKALTAHCFFGGVL